jgi:gliding motility-associated-like protein
MNTRIRTQGHRISTNCTLYLLAMVMYCTHAFGQEVQSTISKSYNISSFKTSEKKTVDEELLQATEPAFRSHPEFGILPDNAPCKDCYEVLQKRTDQTRYFVKKGTHGKAFLIQKGYSAINYKDGQGNLRSVYAKLRPDAAQEGLYSAMNQMSPIKLDVKNRFASIATSKQEFVFNHDLQLCHQDAGGIKTVIAQADWSHYTVGLDGALVTNIFPDIDMHIIVYEGRVKTNFIVKKQQALADGWLLIEDRVVIPQGFKLSTSKAFQGEGGQWKGDLDLVGDTRDISFTIHSGLAYDHKGKSSGFVTLGYKLENGVLGIYLPAAWMNNASRQFPLTIDPLVSTTNTLNMTAPVKGATFQNPPYAAGGCGGGFSVSSPGGCPYSMTVNSPANCTITNIWYQLDYDTKNSCVKDDGGLIFTYLGCQSPLASAQIAHGCHTCDGLGGLCFTTAPGISLYSDFQSCIPAPQCAAYPITIGLKMYQSGDNSLGACSTGCIEAASDWILTIEGHTVEQNPGPSSSAGATICSGSSTTLTAAGQYGVPPYTSYSWSPATGLSSTSGISVLANPTSTTTYTCTITDKCGVTASNTVTVNVTGPTITAGTSQTVCAGSSVNLTSNAGGNSTGVTWSGGTGIFSPATTSANPTYALGAGETSGTVTLTATTKNPPGCPPLSASVVLTINPKPTVTNAPMTQSVCSGGSTTAVTLTSGVAGTTFAWTASATPGVTGFATSGTGTIPVQTLSTTGSSPGTVTYAITPTAATCAGPVANYTITVNPTPTITNNPLAQSTCSGGTTTAVTLTSAATGATFTWTSTATAGISGYTASGTNTIPAQAISITGTNPGTVTYAITATANGCTATANYVITVNPSLAVTNAPLSQSVCSGSNSNLITLTANIGGATFAWTATATAGISGFATSGTSTIPVQTLTTTSTSPGTVTYVVSASANGCTSGSPANYVITVNPIPTLSNVSTSQTICSGASTAAVNLTSAVAGTTYAWTASGPPSASGYATSGTNTIPVQTITNSSTQIDTVNYSITLTANGCSAASPTNYAVYVNPIPRLTNASTSQTICSGASTTLVNLTSGVAGTSFSWTATGPPSASGYASSGTNTIPVQTITNTGSTADTVVYAVILTAKGCAASSPSNYLVIVNPVPKLSNASSSQTICSGATTTAVNLTSTVAGTTFAWTASGSPTASGFATSGTNTIPAQTITNSGSVADTVTYSVILTANGCTAPAAGLYYVYINPIPKLSNLSNSQTICSGGSTTAVTLSSGVAGTTFAWTASGPPSASGYATSGTTIIPVQTITNSGNVADTITYLITLAANGCSATLPSKYLVIVNPIPKLSNVSTSQTICSGASTTLVNLSSTVSGTTFAWTATGSPTASGYATSGTNTIPVQTISNSGTKADTVHYAVVLTASGCAAGTPSMYDVIINPVTPGAIASSPADYCQGDPIAPLTATGTGVKWYSDPALTQLVGTGNTFTPPAGTGTVTYYATQTVNGCQSATGTAVTVNVNPRPSAAFTATPPKGLTPLNVNFTVNSPGAGTYSWTFGNNSGGTGAAVSTVYPVKGYFTVICTSSLNGCSDTSSLVVYVEESYTLIIPNVFTPNGDNSNDVYLVSGTGLTNFHMEIYDRWGVKMFNSDYIGDGWNGRTSGGGDVPAGTYYYVIQVKEAFTGESKLYKGPLLLIR